MERCTLTTIAQAAGVSVSTVSYALRGDPKIPAGTAQRIRNVAEQLGYTANPSVSALMAHIRNGRQLSQTEVLAFVWIEKLRAVPGSAFDAQSIAGVRARAEELGFTVEEFYLSDPGMSARRVSEILQARGICGVVFSGCECATDVKLEMNWPAHAAAIIGNAGWQPELHRAAYHHFLNMRRILLELAERGYRRPGAWLEEIVNERAHRAWEGAFLAFHPEPRAASALVHRFTQVDFVATARWLRDTQPDAVILTKPAFAPLLRELCGSTLPLPGLVVLDLTGLSESLCGIDPGVRFVAANAVDLVVGQLYRNERGLPAHPKKMLFEGHWCEGDSLLERRALKSEHSHPRAKTGINATIS